MITKYLRNCGRFAAILWALSLSFNAQAQGVVADTMEQRLSSMPDDTAKANTLNSLARKYILLPEFRDIDKGFAFARKGLQIADSLEYVVGKAELNRTLGAAYFFLEDYNQALTHYDVALEMNLMLKNTNNEARCYFNIALCYSRLAKHYEAMENMQKSLTLKKQLGDKKEILPVYRQIITTCRTLKDYPLALSYLDEAIGVARETDNIEYMAKLQEQYGITYLAMSSYDASIRHFNSAIALLNMIHDTLSSARVMIHLSSVFEVEKNWRKALDYRLEAAKIYEHAKLSWENNNLSEVYQYVSNSYVNINKLDSAFYFRDLAISTAQRRNDKKKLADIYNEAGKFYFLLHNLDKTEKYYQLAETTAAAIQYDKACSDALEGLSRLYAAKGDYRKAYAMFSRLHDVSAKIAETARKKEVENLTKHYEFEKARHDKDVQIKMRVEQQAQLLDQQKQKFIIISIALAMAAVLLAIVIRSSRKERKASALLREQHAHISKMNDELSMYKVSLEDMVRQQTLRLRRGERQLQSLSSNLSNGMMFQEYDFGDSCSIMSYISKSVGKWFDVSDEEVLADINVMYSRINPDDYELRTELRKVFARSLQPYSCEYRIKKDGRNIWLLESATPHLSKCHAVVWDGVIVDITERKENEREIIEAREKAEESDRLKSTFLANMSHELRTPMNGIIGFLMFLEKDNLPVEKRIFYINIIRNNIRQLLQIVGDILDISKLDTHQMVIHPDEIDVNRMMRETEAFYVDFIGTNAKIEIALDTTDAVEPCTIVADPTRVSQVMRNLMNNAVKFTNFGFIRFGYRLDKANDEIIFFVEDSGVGISKDDQEVIFDCFRQVYDQNKHTHYRGVGLGLSISHDLVSLMGGRIWLESEEGIGSTFYFSLPMHVTAHNKTCRLQTPTKIENEVYA